MKYLMILAAVFLILPAQGDANAPDLSAMARADVVILGEVHDNPRHHEVQAASVAALQPAALVFEMLSAAQAGLITAENRRDQRELGDVLDWENSGWPDFAFYYPIFAAAPEARIFGARLTRMAARAAFKAGIVADFGPQASLYGLDIPLGAAEQAAREAFQRAAHCDALPEDMLGRMVDLQRLRDAYLARAVVRALEQGGAPVVVITGNGHARADRGLAVYLARARPDVAIYTLGLSEAGQIDGVFDKVLDFAAAPRPDPCLAFGKSD